MTPNESPASHHDDWQPTASLKTLHLRAGLSAAVRGFFRERGVMEIETPLLSWDTTVDAHLEPIRARLENDELFLQTSPEFAMKRMLAAGAGDIYQFTRAFRAGEAGARHNPEFTIVEWYRVGWNHLRLMDEVAALIQELLGLSAIGRVAYRDAFDAALGLDPLTATDSDVRGATTEASSGTFEAAHRDDHLNYLLNTHVEPWLQQQGPMLLYDYPASQAALAKTATRDNGTKVAERFELYVDGLELCNGYHELTEPEELERRIADQNQRRVALGLSELPVESRLLSAMRAGFPDCAGVALGFDRLVMLAAGVERIDQVLAFPVDRA